MQRVSGRKWYDDGDDNGQDAAREVLQDLALSAVVIERMGGASRDAPVLVFREGEALVIRIRGGVMLSAMHIGGMQSSVLEREPRQRPRRRPRDGEENVPREQGPPAAQRATHRGATVPGGMRSHFRPPAPSSSTVTIVVTVPIRWKVSVSGNRSPARSGCLRSMSMR